MLHLVSKYILVTHDTYIESRITLLAAMLVSTLVSLFALAQATNTVPPEIDEINNLHLDEFEDFGFGFDHIADPMEKAGREQALRVSEDMVKKASEAFVNGKTTQDPEGCLRKEGAYICNTGNATKTETEDECAASCWGIETCHFYTYGHGLCYLMETASNCTGQIEGFTWGSWTCGAPTNA